MIYVLVDGKWHETGEDINASLTTCEVEIPYESPWTRELPDEDACPECFKVAK